MKIHNVEQNSPAWDALHLGRPTASDFDKIVTPVHAELSKQAGAFAFYKLAEAILNEQLVSLSHLEWISRGKELEDDAVGAYEFINGVTTQKVGFVTTDDGHFGCSPDRIVLDDAGGWAHLLEVKCPAPQTHLNYWGEGPGAGYKPQMFGQMWICGLDAVDFFSYHPRLRSVQVRVHREPMYMGRLVRALSAFDDLFQTLQIRARREGFFEVRDNPVTTVDKLAEELREHPSFTWAGPTE